MAAIVPPPTVLAAQRTFRTLLDAMAHPGTVYHLPRTGDDAPAVTICLALLDYEVSYAVANAGTHADDAIAALAERIALQTGCRRVDVSDAAFVLSYGPLPERAWGQLRRGTLAFPDQGATIIVVVASVGEETGSSRVTVVRLTGPGIETERVLTVGGFDAAEFERLSSVNADYPMGVDAIFVDADGRLACIPRSSAIAVSEEA